AHMFRNDAKLAEKAATISTLAKDLTEVAEMLDLQLKPVPRFKIAYHSACSMQHGQQIKELPFELLRKAGFDVTPVPEGHICCGSAGTYNLMQPELAGRLQQRKVRNIESVAPDLVAAGNLGCMIQIGQATDVPIVHTVELLDWATGGDVPEAIEPLVKDMPEYNPWLREAAE
ncbi:MAG: heterodisulfide reductase-related iron-sulfur binding cluster, partial [Pseudomonadota bacterium]